MKTRSIQLLVLALVLALIPAVGASAQEGQARLRVVHASPDAPAVDVWVNGSVAVSSLAFKEATGYVDLAPGTYDVQVTPAGGSAADAVIDADVTLESGNDYTVAAVGQLANIAPLVLADDNTQPAAGKAHLRVVHASPDAPAVDVAVTGGSVLIENLAFTEASDYLPVDTGSYDLSVLPTGTQDSALDIPGFMADPGSVYTVFAVGLAGDGSLSALPLVDSSTSTGGAMTSPGMPHTGAGGTAMDSAGLNVWYVALAGLLAISLMTGGVALARQGTVRARVK